MILALDRVFCYIVLIFIFIGSGSPLRPFPVPGTADSEQFGRPFAPQDCDELNACVAAADCKNE
jgi:hypothetical protein